ncbi:MAG TPA: hypothetical protein VMV38_02485, partial [Candidatus Paceibacterota bacterium]|nr:hypothetical protein [Candidatus Paceibacterota bacterium]
STSSKVLPAQATISDFHTGDFVGVEGVINSGSSWSITASLIRDWTARQALTQEVKTNVQAVHALESSQAHIVQGALSSLDATAQTFTLTNASGVSYTVSLASGAKILAKNWATLDFTKVTNGDHVRVFGTVSSSTISASIFRDISVK